MVPHLVPRTAAHLGVTQLNVLPRHKPWIKTKPGRATPGRLVQPRRPGLQPLGGVGGRCQHPESVAASPRLPLSGVRPANPGARRRDHARPEPARPRPLGRTVAARGPLLPPRGRVSPNRAQPPRPETLPEDARVRVQWAWEVVTLLAGASYGRNRLPLGSLTPRTQTGGGDERFQHRPPPGFQRTRAPRPFPVWGFEKATQPGPGHNI